MNVPTIVLTRKPYSAAVKQKQAKNRLKNWFFFNPSNTDMWVPDLTPLDILAFTLFTKLTSLFLSPFLHRIVPVSVDDVVIVA